MKNILTLIFITIALSTTAQNSVNVSITVPSIALLDIAPNNTAFNLNLVAPTEAGNIATLNPTNSTKSINFTSAVGVGITRRITAQVSGTIPTGINLRLVVSNYAGTGGGILGTSAGTLILNGTPQIAINNIGGAFTGDGVNNGYRLNYSLEINNYSLLRSQSGTFSIIYTMSDN
ncbi:MAG: hypothetical protein RLZZ306_2519 [Bacteroidota bacterium]|jgi:hypothetical protein